MATVSICTDGLTTDRARVIVNGILVTLEQFGDIAKRIVSVALKHDHRNDSVVATVVLSDPEVPTMEVRQYERFFDIRAADQIGEVEVSERFMQQIRSVIGERAQYFAHQARALEQLLATSAPATV